jgi:hypothetical protein
MTSNFSGEDSELLKEVTSLLSKVENSTRKKQEETASLKRKIEVLKAENETLTKRNKELEVRGKGEKSLNRLICRFVSVQEGNLKAFTKYMVKHHNSIRRGEISAPLLNVKKIDCAPLSRCMFNGDSSITTTPLYPRQPSVRPTTKPHDESPLTLVLEEEEEHTEEEDNNNDEEEEDNPTDEDEEFTLVDDEDDGELSEDEEQNEIIDEVCEDSGVVEKNPYRYILKSKVDYPVENVIEIFETVGIRDYGYFATEVGTVSYSAIMGKIRKYAQKYKKDCLQQNEQFFKAYFEKY